VSRDRGPMAALCGLALALVAAGCSKEQIVSEAVGAGKLFLWGVGAFLLLGLLVLAWCRSKVLGLLVTAVVVAGYAAYHYSAHKPYVEPPPGEPYAEVRLLVSRDSAAYFTVWIDDRDIGLAGRASRSETGSSHSTGEEGCAVRVTPGSHEMRVSYWGGHGMGLQFTSQDLKRTFTASAGQTVYMSLHDDPAGTISVREMRELEYRVHREQMKELEKELKKKRPANLSSLLPAVERRVTREYLKELVEKELSKKDLPAEERSRLTQQMVDQLEREYWKSRAQAAKQPAK